MMMDYEYTFSRILHSKIKEKVNARCYVTVIDDAVMVKIENEDGLIYRTYIDNFADKLLHGYSSDYAAYEVLREYRKFINNKYFR